MFPPQVCDRLPVCTGVTYVPTCAENTQTDNCYFSTDTSAQFSRPRVRDVALASRAECALRTYVKSCESLGR